MNNAGLHTRPCDRIEKTAKIYKSEIVLEYKGLLFNAKNIISLEAMAAGKGSEIIIHINGPDETEALYSIEKLFLDGFGEL